MRFDVLTVFPELFEPFARIGVLGRAIEAELLDFETHDLRFWAQNRWKQLDDEPYGGGAGMVIQAPPVLRAVEELRSGPAGESELILLSPRGRVFDQELAEDLSRTPGILLLCGRYEGFDERVSEILRPREVSIGDYVLGGGECAAMVLIETVSRLLPGVVGDYDSVLEDSFADGLLDFPAYTRPAEVRGIRVPDVLLSGHHEKIRRWRLTQSVRETLRRRPDLVRKNWKLYSPEVRKLLLRYAPDLVENIRETALLETSCD